MILNNGNNREGMILPNSAKIENNKVSLNYETIPCDKMDIEMDIEMEMEKHNIKNILDEFCFENVQFSYKLYYEQVSEENGTLVLKEDLLNSISESIILALSDKDLKKLILPTIDQECQSPIESDEEAKSIDGDDYVDKASTVDPFGFSGTEYRNPPTYTEHFVEVSKTKPPNTFFFKWFVEMDKAENNIHVIERVNRVVEVSLKNLDLPQPFAVVYHVLAKIMVEVEKDIEDPTELWLEDVILETVMIKESNVLTVKDLDMIGDGCTLVATRDIFYRTKNFVEEMVKRQQCLNQGSATSY